MRFTYRRKCPAIFEQYPTPWNWTMGSISTVNGKVICNYMLGDQQSIVAVWGLYIHAPPQGCRATGLPPLLALHPLPWRLDITDRYNFHGEIIVLRDRRGFAVMAEECRPEVARIMYGLAMLHDDRAYVRYATWVQSRSNSRRTPQ